jgi:archaellum component FlaC
MTASGTTINQVSINFVHAVKNKDLPRQHHDADKTENSLKNDQTEWIKADQGIFESAKFQAFKSSLNAVAKNIRNADKTMEEIETYIEAMKAQLERIVKNYPPFPPGSEERIEKLRSFNTFRKQIDELTIPPPNKEFLPISPAGDLAAKPEENGFTVPEVPEDAEDEEINASMATLDTAKETLRQRRRDLYTDALRIKSWQGMDIEVEEQAFSELRSMKVKAELMDKSTGALTKTHRQFVELLS